MAADQMTVTNMAIFCYPVYPNLINEVGKTLVQFIFRKRMDIVLGTNSAEIG